MTPEKMAELIKQIDHSGGCHIVVDDLNIDDECIRFCMDYPETTAFERCVMAELLKMSEDDREKAFVIAEGYPCFD